MKVAVTGAAGFLGTNLLHQLVERGHEVTAIDRVRPTGATDPAVTWVNGDVLDPESMRSALAGAEVVYHLVAVITLAQRNDLAWRVNTQGVRVVAEAALAVGARRMVHASSIHAFNQYSCGGRIDENAPRSIDASLPVYDRSKFQGEVELRAVIDQGLDAVICNPTGVYGPVDHSDSRINTTLWDAARGRVPVMIGGGFDLVDVRDVATGLILAGENGRTGENYLLSGAMVTMLEVTRLAAEVNGKRGPRFAIPAKVISGALPVLEPVGKMFGSDRVSRAAMGALLSAPEIDGTKARTELGYRPRPTEETVRDLVAFYKGEPVGSVFAGMA
ncbi:NAD-dependent epimerase/dehydratase family protein [Nocardia sp. NPDC052254]|uniref:NAD-dependent epimerase/dehydratase family protein n=1 Tax=Nocardia sp. NPDC052254 TaxID=3155681 RepID=UPI003422C1A2